MSGNKPPLVMLSGWSFNSSVWSGLEGVFSEHQKICVNYSQGVNEFKEEQGGKPSQYAKKVLNLLEQEQVDNCLIMGWSLGAMVALEVAAHSAKVRGLILVAGTPMFIETPGYEGGLAKSLVLRLKKRLGRNMIMALKELSELMFCVEEISQGLPVRFAKETLTDEHGWSNEEIGAGLDYLINMDLRMVLDTIEVPTLIVHGENDQICPIEAGLFLQAGLPNSQMEVFEDCGHLPFFSQHEIFVERVGRWLYECR